MQGRLYVKHDGDVLRVQHATSGNVAKCLFRVQLFHCARIQSTVFRNNIQAFSHITKGTEKGVKLSTLHWQSGTLLVTGVADVIQT